MGRNFYIDTTNQRLAVSTTSLTPAPVPEFVCGDTNVFNLYFLEATGNIANPFIVVNKSSSSVKLAIGSKMALPTSGTYTLSFSAQTTGAINYSATSGTIQQSLNLLSTIISAGGVSVSGSAETSFIISFGNIGQRNTIIANVSQMIPSTTAFIEKRITGSVTTKEVQELTFRVNPAVSQNTWANTGTSISGESIKSASVILNKNLLNDIMQDSLRSTLDFEIELTDSDVINTIISCPCIVKKQLIQ